MSKWRAREVAGLLFDSLRKLESLGDQAVIYPAHVAGSVCGSGMADREAFIDAKVAEHHEQPPYFSWMEAGNLRGAAAVRHPLGPTPLTAPEFKSIRERVKLVDVRSAAAFLGAHLPDSIALPVGMISAFAGWLLDSEDTIALVAEDAAQAEEAARHFARIGYDNIDGYLAPSLVAWAAAGEAFGSLPVVDAGTVKERLGEAGAWTLLDVRSEEEHAAAKITGAEQLYIGELPQQLDVLDRSRAHTVMCGSGARATIAASILLRAGSERVDLFLGSMSAWRQRGYEVQGAS